MIHRLVWDVLERTDNAHGTITCVNCGFTAEYSTYERAVGEAELGDECPHCKYNGGEKFNIAEGVRNVRDFVLKYFKRARLSNYIIKTHEQFFESHGYDIISADDSNTGKEIRLCEVRE